MKIQGCDCSIVIKTAHHEFDVPYSEETIREAVSLLQEEAAIEGDGNRKAIVKKCGVTGCVVTPITIETAPLLLYLAMGSAGLPVFVSESRDMYRYQLNLLPLEDTDCFDLIQDRRKSEINRTFSSEQLTVNSERRLFEGCRVNGFELRIQNNEAIKLKLDICGEHPAMVCPYSERIERECTTNSGSERFNGDSVSYSINGLENTNIYGLTLVVKKDGGTKTELWIKRVLHNIDLPQNIEELTITAKLLKDKYEYRYFGMFRITIKNLILISDETNVNNADTVIAPLRYYVSGAVSTEVFSSTEEALP